MKNDLVSSEKAIPMLPKLPGRTYDFTDVWCPLPVLCLALSCPDLSNNFRDSLLHTGLPLSSLLQKSTS